MGNTTTKLTPEDLDQLSQITNCTLSKNYFTFSYYTFFYIGYTNVCKVDRKEIEKMFKVAMKGNETGLINGEQFVDFMKSVGINEDFISQLLFGKLFFLLFIIIITIIYYRICMYHIYIPRLM